MRTKRKSGAAGRLAFLLALCLLVGTIGMAGAAGDEVSLKIVPPNFEDDGVRSDFEGAGVVADLYLVAAAEKVAGYATYEYYPVEPFDTLSIDVADNEAWQQLAQDAAAIVKGGAAATVTGASLETQITKTDDGDPLVPGIYLVIPRGGSVTDYWTTSGDDDSLIATRALSGKYEYIFSPQLVALPGKDDGNGDGTVTTADDDGEWIFDVTLVLKFTMKENSVEIIIEKTVEDFEGEKAMFVFQVDAYRGDELVFSDIATITMTESGTVTVPVEGIPAGTDVTVTEVHEGTRYDVVGEDSQTIEGIKSGDTFSFENSFNGSIVNGHGIENHFTWVENEDGTGGTWSLEQR